jgi:UDP-N-acetylmuramoylalanine--D-glutamate ligase
MILQNWPFFADCQSMFSSLPDDKASLLQLNGFLVLGGGISGESAGRLLKKQGLDVVLADQSGKSKDTSIFRKVLIDSDPENALTGISAVIKSPGISPEHPILVLARKLGLPILSEIYLGRLFFEGLMIGITGTDGKSTTTALTHHLMKTKFPKSEVGGNLGLPFTSFCDQNLDLVVLELSSYQLEDSPNLKLTSSAIITLAPDHLERHKTMDRYARAKWKIVDHQNKNHTLVTQKSVIEQMPADREEFLGTELHFGLRDDISIDSIAKQINTKSNQYDTSTYRLEGFHNLQNLAVAIALCESVGMTTLEIQKGIGTFNGLPHRFQSVSKDSWKVENYKKVNFINDSKATNFHSMLSGIAGYTPTDKLFLILGGEPKEESLDPFFVRANALDCEIFIYGKAAQVWKETFEARLPKRTTYVKNIEEALLLIKPILKENQNVSVVLSPACASFDQYKNFSERGDDFIRLVNQIFGGRT